MIIDRYIAGLFLTQNETRFLANNLPLPLANNLAADIKGVSRLSSHPVQHEEVLWTSTPSCKGCDETACAPENQWLKPSAKAKATHLWHSATEGMSHMP